MYYQLEIQLKDSIKILYFDTEEDAKRYLRTCEHAIMDYKLKNLEKDEKLEETNIIGEL